MRAIMTAAVILGYFLAITVASPARAEKLPAFEKGKNFNKDQIESALRGALNDDSIEVKEASKGARAEGYVLHSDDDVLYLVPDPCAKHLEPLMFHQPCDREKTGETKSCEKVPGKKYEVEAVRERKGK